MKLTRRDFLTFAGFTAVGVAGGVYLKNQILPREAYYLEGDFRSRHEELKRSTCGMCPAACGIQVRFVDGLAVKIEGNPHCPISKGKLCPKGQMGLELHYNPDRIMSPLRRVGEPGSQEWESLSWDEALALLGSKVGTALKDRNGSGVSVLAAEEQSIGSHLWHQLQAKQVDRWNLTQINALRDRAVLPALETMFGRAEWPVYDLDNSDLILAFDTPLVSGWSSPTMMIGKYAEFRRGRDRTRGRLVYVGSRRSMDAVNADTYVQVTPYTSAVLALGMAHVIVREQRYDEKFVARHCSGFESLKATLLTDFRTRTVSEITGVQVETINSLARMFADSSHPIAIGERIPQPSQAWEQMAYLTLNILKGNIGIEGGLNFQERLTFGDIQPPEFPRREHRNPDHSELEQLESGILGGARVPGVLLVDNVNPSAVARPGHNWSDILGRVPFVVSFSPYPNFVTTQADLVLPDLGYLEKPTDLLHSPALGYPTASVTDAVAAPIGEGMDTRVIQQLLLDEQFIDEGKVDLEAAKQRFKSVRESFHRHIFEAKRGLIYDTSFVREWIERMESGGWWSSDFDNFEEFDESLRHRGGWTDPYVQAKGDENRVIRAGQKINMAGVAEALSLSDIFSGKITPKPPDISSDSWVTITVVPTTMISISALPYGNIPHLLEFPEPGVVTGWEPWLELHSSTAERLELIDEDIIEIEANNNLLQCRVIISDGLHPNIGAIPFGMFGLGEGSWVQDNMKRPLESHAPRATDGQIPRGLIVKIRKV